MEGNSPAFLDKKPKMTLKDYSVYASNRKLPNVKNLYGMNPKTNSNSAIKYPLSQKIQCIDLQL